MSTLPESATHPLVIWLDNLLPESLPAGEVAASMCEAPQRIDRAYAELLGGYSVDEGVNKLSVETPASYVAFDLLAIGDEDLRTMPLVTRRSKLEAMFSKATAPLHLTPSTRDPEIAADWFSLTASDAGAATCTGSFTAVTAKETCALDVFGSELPPLSTEPRK